jgi:hypothetical protein
MIFAGGKMSRILEQATEFIWYSARHLERAVFEFFFRGGSPERVISILNTYQNNDGGFGHALEPDLRCADSQPLFVEFGLRTLYDCQIHAPKLVNPVCGFVKRHADLKAGIPTLFPSANDYPKAGHWENPSAFQPSFDRLTSLVGLLNWQGVKHAWLSEAVDACLEHIATHQYCDAHTILNAFCLIESLPESSFSKKLYKKLAEELFQADFFQAEVPVTTYGLTPLDFASSPTSFYRGIFSDMQIHAHLDELASRQDDDGGWPISWGPPGEMAKLEWRAYGTVKALRTLRAYGRI